MLTNTREPGASPTPDGKAGPSTSAVPDSSLYVSAVKTDGSVSQKCFYTSCRAHVRPTSTEYHHELVVSRAEGEASDDDLLVPERLVFPIDKSSRFEAEESRVAWCDRAGKRYNLEFEDQDSASILTDEIRRALFQSIHSKISGPSDQETLQALLSVPSLPTESELLDARGELTRVPGGLFKYDVDSQSFEMMFASVTITLNSAVVREDHSRAYLLIVYKPESRDRVLECEVDNSMNAQFYAQSLSFVWVLNVDPGSEDSESLCLSVKFEDAEEFVMFRNQFSVCLYEVNHQASMDDLKLKEDDRKYVAESLRDDVDPMEIDDDSGASDSEDERSISEGSENRRASLGTIDDGFRNTHLAVGATCDRTFVVRGNKIGVFSADDDGAEYKQTINFKDPKTGSLFTPSNILLHQQDASMIVLDSVDETKLMRMDLERGEVVDTWSGGLTSNTPVKAVQRVSKYANLTNTQEFVGLNKNQLMRMDPRTKEFIVQSKRYAAGTRARLDSVATTGAGYLAVASENGDIRLYDQIGKNAKTHLPGLGDQVIGIDVSEDGNYVLATTAKYLLVIDTRVKGEAKGGFQKSMGKNKPAPRKLVINNEDIAKHRMGTICFTTAHFNTGSSLERSIVTSTGPFVVIWNFRAVKMGRLDRYRIQRYQDNIVADDFAYDNDGRVVITLPNQVGIAHR